MVELLTPFKYVNRVTRKLATELNLNDETNAHFIKSVEPTFRAGDIVAQTTDGIVDMSFGFTEDDYALFLTDTPNRVGYGKGYTPVIALSDVNQKKDTQTYNYETGDTKVGSVSTIDTFNARVRVSEDMLWLPKHPTTGDFTNDETRWDETSGHHTLEVGKEIFVVNVMGGNVNIADTPNNIELTKELIRNAGKYTVFSTKQDKMLVGTIDEVDFKRREIVVKLTPGIRTA